MKRYNVGLFVEDLDADKDIISKIYNDYKETSNTVIDFSIFFKRIGKIDNEIKCGFFNASNLTDFHGHLLCYNLDAIKMAQSVVNNITIYGLCDQLDVTKYFDLQVAKNNIYYIVFNELQKKNFYRVTGEDVKLYDKNIIDIIREMNNE